MKSKYREVPFVRAYYNQPHSLYLHGFITSASKNMAATFNSRLLDLIAHRREDEALEILKNMSHPSILVDRTGRTLLHYAAKNGNDRVAQYLIDSGADVDAQDCDGKTPLMLAVRYFRTYEVVDLLLRSNASIHVRDNVKGRNAFQQAHPKMRTNILKKVSKLCPDAADEIAAEFVKWGCCVPCSFELENSEVTRSLLARGFPLECPERSWNGRSALTLAIINKDLENARALLDYGVDVNARDEEGRTALHHVDPSDLPSVNLLLERGAAVDARDSSGVTPLMMILYRSVNYEDALTLYLYKPMFIEPAKRVVERLLSRGVDPQASAPNPKYAIFFKRAIQLNFYRLQPVLAHLALIQARGMPIERDIGSKINDHDPLRKYFEECEQQLEKMKQARVWRSITLHELLIVSQSKIECYVRNTQLLLNLRCMKNKNEYMPYYVYVLRDRIERAVRIVSLRKEVAAILCRTSELRQNSFCIDKITGYLSENDLQKFYCDK